MAKTKTTPRQSVDDDTAVDFRIIDGKTYISKRKKGKKQEKLFLDITAQIIGEVADTNQQHFYWLMHLTPPNGMGESPKNIMMLPSILNYHKQFVEEVQKHVKKASSGESMDRSNMCLYVQMLKNKYYEGGMGAKYQLVNKIGYQNLGWWVLSQENQYECGKKLVDNNIKGYLTPSIREEDYFMSIDDDVISSMQSFLETLKKFYRLSQCFDNNLLSFNMIIAYVVRHLVNIQSQNSIGADEPKYGHIYSQSMSCGKTNTQFIVMYGQGCPKQKHKYMLAGGDLEKNGLSSSMARKIMATTNMVVCLNDIHNCSSKSCDFLLQSHESILQGNSATGLVQTECGILVTSNEPVPERLSGRMLAFEFKSSPTYKDENDEQLKALLKFAEKRKGFLTAWATILGSFCYEHLKELKNGFLEELKKYSEGYQTRIVKGWADLLSFLTMFYISCGETANIELEKILEYGLKEIKNTNAGNALLQAETLSNTIQTLEKCLLVYVQTKPPKERKEMKINAKTKFTVESTSRVYQSVSFSYGKINREPIFNEINFKNLKDTLIEKYGKRIFSTNKKDKKSSRVLKIPKELLTDNIIEALSKDIEAEHESETSSQHPDDLADCDKTEEQPSEDESSNNEASDNEDEASEEEFIESFQPWDLGRINISVENIKEKFQKFVEEKQKKDDFTQVGTPFVKNLPPKLQELYKNYSAEQKEAFHEGMSYCRRDVLGKEKESLAFHIELNNKLEETVLVNINSKQRRIQQEIEGMSVRRLLVKFKCGESFRLQAKIGGATKNFGDQDHLVINPERNKTIKVDIN